LVIVREIGDRTGEGIALGNMGIAYADLGETGRAIQFFEQRLTLAREIGDRRGEGNVLGNLGTAYLHSGETHRAIQFFEQALLIDREIGDRRGEGNALWNMSLALDQLGERAQAIKHAEQALIILEQIEDPNAAKCASNLPSGESKQRRETHFRTGKLSLSVPEHCYTHPQPYRANRLSNQGC
jgi:tetratricopeptide (TPR) repeat protein